MVVLEVAEAHSDLDLVSDQEVMVGMVAPTAVVVLSPKS